MDLASVPARQCKRFFSVSRDQKRIAFGLDDRAHYVADQWLIFCDEHDEIGFFPQCARLIVAVNGECNMPRDFQAQAKDYDFTTVAKRVVEQAIGEQWDGLPLPHKDKNKNPAAAALGKLGGAKGGVARALEASSRKRKMIAKKAA
jgi:hypothetical protein